MSELDPRLSRRGVLKGVAGTLIAAGTTRGVEAKPHVNGTETSSERPDVDLKIPVLEEGRDGVDFLELAQDFVKQLEALFEKRPQALALSEIPESQEILRQYVGKYAEQYKKAYGIEKEDVTPQLEEQALAVATFYALYGGKEGKIRNALLKEWQLRSDANVRSSFDGDQK